MSERPKTIHEKLDALQATVETLANHVIRIDQNTIVLAGRLDAIEAEVTGIKPAIDQLQRAVVIVGKDVSDIRDRVIEQDDRLGGRLRVLENGSHANGQK